MERATRPLVAFAPSTALAACASDTSRRWAIAQKSASQCYDAVDSAKCRMAHDRAGGHPIARGGGRD